ncbi:hypothetical protein QFC20_006705 [Naganishia adeliensis]|uniref:Uncharacterized protein n=1 Tax=Naganishia adeliensis TaxID=92952 RepID=A0ACC2V7X0_9TREE|nr:hypothetical protein QFC20_006705 [Naganishia adeliensis]
MDPSHSNQLGDDNESVASSEGTPHEHDKPEGAQQQEEEKLKPVLLLQSDTKALLKKIQDIMNDRSADSDYLFQNGYMIDSDIETLLERWNDFPSGIQLEEKLNDELMKLRDQFNKVVPVVRKRGAEWAAKDRANKVRFRRTEYGLPSLRGYRHYEPAEHSMDPCSFSETSFALFPEELPNDPATLLREADCRQFTLVNSPLDPEAASKPSSHHQRGFSGCLRLH